MKWNLKGELRKRLAEEDGALVPVPGARSSFALVYPNNYHVGMSNLGMHILYQLINERTDTDCERAFLPDAKELAEYVRTQTPIMTLETQRPLGKFDLIGFAVSFEMDYFNILTQLELSRIPLRAAERDEYQPLILMGGPCVTFNPEPLAAVADVCIIGEGEEVVGEVLDAYHAARMAGESRLSTLCRLAQIEGVYVPIFYQARYSESGAFLGLAVQDGLPEKIGRRWIKELDRYPAKTVIQTPHTEFRNMLLLEVARGCGRHCRYCMAGYCFRRPRNRSLDELKRSVEAQDMSERRVGLMGAAISDYPEIDELCRWLRERNIALSVASLRADSVSETLVAALAESGHRTITLAPEAATQRLRTIINKTLTEEDLFSAAAMAVKAGIPHVRMYIMIGLPEETDEDIEAIVQLALRMKAHMLQLGSKGKLTLSVNPFVPKPFTPFQWLPMAEQSVVAKRLKYLQQAFKGQRSIEVLTESPKEAYLQGILARGDRRVGEALLAAQASGGSKQLARAMTQAGLQKEDYLYRNRAAKEVLPWDHLLPGVTKDYLQVEWQRSLAEQETAPCHTGCKRCGVCK